MNGAILIKENVPISSEIFISVIWNPNLFYPHNAINLSCLKVVQLVHSSRQVNGRSKLYKAIKTSGLFYCAIEEVHYFY